MSKVKVDKNDWENKSLLDFNIDSFKGINAEKNSEGNFFLIPSGAVFPDGIKREKVSRIKLKNKSDIIKILKDNDVLFNTGGEGTLGRSMFFKLTNDRYFCDSFVLVIRNEDLELDSKYLFYVFNSSNFQCHVRRYTIGTTGITAIKENDVINFKCDYPKRIEQSKIAEILTSVDEVIENNDQTIKKYERIKQGLMQDLLTKGIDENGNIRSKETHEFKDSPLGRIPVEWNIKRLSEVTEITRLAGYEYSTLWEDVEDGEIIALRGYNIGENEIIDKEISRITKKLSNRLIRSKLFIDDVVFPCVGTVGNAVSVKENDKYHINQNIAKITPGNKLDSDFLVYYLMSEHGRREIDKYNATSTQPNILVGSLRKFLIFVPKRKDEQEKISIFIKKIIESRKLEENKLKKLCQIKNGLMQDLLSGEVRVNHLLR